MPASAEAEYEIAATPNASGATNLCRKLLQDAYDKLRESKPDDPAGDCPDKACDAALTVEEWVAAISERAKTLPPNDADTVNRAAAAIRQQIDAIKSTLKDIGHVPKPLRALYYAKHVCEEITASIAARIGEMTAGLAENAKIAVCEDKLERLPGFLADYYGLTFRDRGGFRIVRARYGDIYNEDRDYWLERGGWDAVRDPKVPRSGKHFRDPEDYFHEDDHFYNGTDPAYWDRSRHTCDVTWYFKKLCETRTQITNVTVDAGDQHCFISKTTAPADTDFCGYDPSPRGDKRLHVLFSCGGKEQNRQVKLPGATTKIPLMCAIPERDLARELQYFMSEPCAVSANVLPPPRASAGQAGQHLPTAGTAEIGQRPAAGPEPGS